MWFNETLASRMVPYHHIIGGENGMGEDRRWLEPARKYFEWMARHDTHFVNKQSIANIGVVMGQRTHLFYRPPRGVQMREYMDGMYYALLEGRFLFDFVHEDKLAPAELTKYSALLLPNTALLSDEQCRQLRAYVDAGGSLLATFETSLYTERNERGPTSDSPMFSESTKPARSSAPSATPISPASRSRTRSSTVLRHHWIPGAENRLPVAPVEGPILTVVPGFVAYPPELSYPSRSTPTNPPSSCAKRARAAWSVSPATSSAPCGSPGHTDLARLLQNAIRWVARRELARDHRRRRRNRNLRLGDAGRFRRAHPQLHESRHAPRLDPRFLSHRPAEGQAVTPAGPSASRGWSCCAPKRTSRLPEAPPASSSRFPELWTTKSPHSIPHDRKQSMTRGQSSSTFPGRSAPIESIKSFDWTASPGLGRIEARVSPDFNFPMPMTMTQAPESSVSVSLFHRISSIVSSNLSLEEMLGEIVGLTVQVTECDACLVYLMDHEENEIVLRASQVPHASALGELRMKMGEGVTGWVAEHKAVVALGSNAAADPRFKRFQALIEDTYEAFLSVPIVSGGEVIGVINVHHREPHEHRPEEIALVVFVGEQMGGVVSRSLLEEEKARLHGRDRGDQAPVGRS